MGQPTAPQLLEAVQLFLQEAENALSGRLAFHAKVARNALGIVVRELEQSPEIAETAALAPFGGADALCKAFRSGAISPEGPAALQAVRAAVLARLAVDNPRYTTFRRLAERPVTPAERMTLPRDNA